MANEQVTPVHVYPLWNMPDVPHRPGTELVQRSDFFQEDCWCCKNGICHQRIDTIPLCENFVVVHGTALQ